MDLSNLSTKKLNFTQLNEQVYEVLRTEILTGQLAPGELISTNTLAELLGVSQIPVREALQRLSNDGLVEIRPRRGTYVAEFSRKEVQEVFGIRRIIELAAADILPQAPDEPIQQMAAIDQKIHTLQDGTVFRDYSIFITLDEAFHRCIVGLLENERLSTFYERLRWCEYVVRHLSLSNHHRAQDTIAEHTEILHAFQTRDVAKAKSAISLHLKNAESDLLRRMPIEDQRERR